MFNFWLVFIQSTKRNYYFQPGRMYSQSFGVFVFPTAMYLYGFGRNTFSLKHSLVFFFMHFEVEKGDTGLLDQSWDQICYLDHIINNLVNICLICRVKHFTQTEIALLGPNRVFYILCQIDSCLTLPKNRYFIFWCWDQKTSCGYMIGLYTMLLCLLFHQKFIPI